MVGGPYLGNLRTGVTMFTKRISHMRLNALIRETHAIVIHSAEDDQGDNHRLHLVTFRVILEHLIRAEE